MTTLIIIAFILFIVLTWYFAKNRSSNDYYSHQISIMRDPEYNIVDRWVGDIGYNKFGVIVARKNTAMELFNLKYWATKPGPNPLDLLDNIIKDKEG